MTETATNTGRFVWYDLMTKDLEQSKAFYSGLFGWTTKSMDMGDKGKYDMLHMGEMPIGGMVALEGPGTEEVPSHWMPYVQTEDIEACLGRSTSGGGTTCVPVTEIPGTGSFAVITDPGGGAISAFQGTPDHAQPIPDVPLPGTFSWCELHADDPEAAKTFYGETFGWNFKSHDMGPMGTYTVITMGTKEVGGIMQRPPGSPGRQAWMPYVSVEDVDADTTKAGELGGTVIMPPMDIPGIGRFSVVQDPGGAVFALYKDAHGKGHGEAQAS